MSMGIGRVKIFILIIEGSGTMSVNKKVRLMTRLVLASILLFAIGYVVYNGLFKEKEVVAAKVGSIGPDFTLENIKEKEQALVNMLDFINFR